MRVSNPRENEWMKDTARGYLCMGEIVCGGILFSYSPKLLKWVNGERVGTWLYLPNDHQRELVGLLEASEYSKAQKEAHLLRKAIVDPKLPSESALVGGNDILFGGGRCYDAILLGKIKYIEALPELVEVAGHDLEKSMRYIALESITNIGKAAKIYAPQIARILHLDKSILVRKTAAETLGKLDDSSVIPTIRAELEEARMLTSKYAEMGYFHETDTQKWDLYWDNAELFENLLTSLFRLNPNAVREEIRKSLGYGSELVAYHTENVVFWCRTNAIIRLPDKMLRDNDFIDL